MSGGSYLLVFRLDTALSSVAIGKLGTFDFTPGWYLYVGSALGSGGLPARLRRHQQRHKARPHWHIDYLRPHLRLHETWAVAAPERLECDWCRALLALPSLSVPARGFGSQDTGCPAHLFYAAAYPGVRALASVVLGSMLHFPPGEQTLALDITSYDERG